MNKFLRVIWMLVAICTNIIFTFAHEEGNTSMFLKDKKVLIVYFSWGGNTKLIAEKIHSQIGGNIFRLEPVTPYPDDYQKTAYGIAKEQKDNNIHPPIKHTDIAPYDVIFVGTPVWWYTMAPPVMTFLSENDFTNKIIIPFITHGGGGAYTIDKDMSNLAKGAKVFTPFVVYEHGDANTDEDIAKWVKTING